MSTALGREYVRWSYSDLTEFHSTVWQQDRRVVFHPNISQQGTDMQITSSITNSIQTHFSRFFWYYKNRNTVHKTEKHNYDNNNANQNNNYYTNKAASENQQIKTQKFYRRRFTFNRPNFQSFPVRPGQKNDLLGLLEQDFLQAGCFSCTETKIKTAKSEKTYSKSWIRCIHHSARYGMIILHSSWYPKTHT